MTRKWLSLMLALTALPLLGATGGALMAKRLAGLDNVVVLRTLSNRADLLSGGDADQIKRLAQGQSLPEMVALLMVVEPPSI